MLLIKNGRVVDPKSGFDQVVDVLVDGKKIIKIADSIEEASAEIIDATGLVVAPGLVDKALNRNLQNRQNRSKC